MAEWLKAVDSKSTVPLWYRGFESLPLRPLRCSVSGEVRERLNRRAWRARGRQKRPVGSNPTLSAHDSPQVIRWYAVCRGVVLGGEVAVPCNPQSAIAGLNSYC